MRLPNNVSVKVEEAIASRSRCISPFTINNFAINTMLKNNDGLKIAFTSDPYYFPTEESEGENCPDIIYYAPINETNSVVSPESQLLPHCNGDVELCSEPSATYHLEFE